MFNKKQDNYSYVRQWANQKRKELEHSNEITPENLFATIMYGLASFAKTDPRRSQDSEFKKTGLDICEHYGNDSSLFEVACYLYFRIDMWLYHNRQNLRVLISTTFIRELNELFTKALKINNISTLLAERIDKYGELARQRKDIQEYYFFLSQLILRTKDNTKPKHYDFGKEPVNLNAFEDTLIKIELLSWEKEMVPRLINNLDKYCDLMEKD